MERPDLIEKITERLTEMPDSALARAYNEICSPNVELVGENEFIQARAFKLGESPSLKAVSGSTVEALDDPTRIVAQDRLQEEDPLTGELHHVRDEYWDVTKRIASMDEREVRDLVDGDYRADRIVGDYSDHEGPRNVYVIDQVRQFWREVYGEPLWEE